MKDQFDDNVIAKIQHENVRPISRWYFATRQWFLITIVAIATVFSSVAVTLILFLLTDHDWFAVSYLDEGLPLHILRTIPYVWLAIIFIVTAIIYSTIRNIGRGYRYDSKKIIGVSVFTSVVLGTILFYTGAGNYLDNYFEHNVPLYNSIIVNNRDIWIYPEEGLLSGKIVQANSNGLIIVDSDDQPWNITSTADTDNRLTKETPGQWIKIVGTMTDGSHFTAALILPFSNERK